MVFTALRCSPGPSFLSTDLVRSCCTISLANIAFSATKTLPKQLWMCSTNYDFYTLLRLCLSSLSPQTVVKCEALPDVLRPLLFNLAVLHTVIVVTASTKVTRTRKHAHLSLFTSCVEQLLLLTRHGASPRVDCNIVLKAVRSHVCEVYSCCILRHKLEELVGICVSEEAVQPSAQIELPGLGVELTVPSQSVTPKMFSNHVKGLLDATGRGANDEVLRYARLKKYMWFIHM